MKRWVSVTRSSLFVIGALAVLHSPLSAAPADPQYVVTDVGGLGPSGDSAPKAINASGDVVGVSSVPCGGPVCGRAFLYSHTGVMAQLGVIGDGSAGYYSAAFGINGRGDAVGTLPEEVPDYSFPGRAVLYPAGGGSEFLPPGTPSAALAINDSGLIVGFTGNLPFGPDEAFLYDPSSGSLTDIHGEIPEAVGSQATAINAGGEVVGWFDKPHPDPYDPFRRTPFVRHSGGSLQELGLPNGMDTNVEPTGINASGQVVGTTNLSSGSQPTRAILWSGGTARDLGTLAPEEPAAMALGINDRGHVVGASSFGFYCPGGAYCARDWHAFVYSDGVMRDLNDLIPADSGWVLQAAMAINDAGQIVATGRNGGSNGAVLLTPAPEALTGDLIDLIRGFGLPHGTENSFLTKLENALAALAQGDPATACDLIGAFINETRAQAGKKLTDAQAAQMIAAAEQIRASIGCQ